MEKMQLSDNVTYKTVEAEDGDPGHRRYEFEKGAVKSVAVDDNGTISVSLRLDGLDADKTKERLTALLKETGMEWETRSGGSTLSASSRSSEHSALLNTVVALATTQDIGCGASNYALLGMDSAHLVIDHEKTIIDGKTAELIERVTGKAPATSGRNV